MGQHVKSQDLDVNKASHCTGSVSSALASGDAGKRTQVPSGENIEESTAAPISISAKSAGQGRKEWTHSG